MIFLDLPTPYGTTWVNLDRVRTISLHSTGSSTVDLGGRYGSITVLLPPIEVIQRMQKALEGWDHA